MKQGSPSWECCRIYIKQWLLAKSARVSQITRANLARRVTFFSKMTFGEFWRVWQVRGKSLANFGEFGESQQNRLANVGEFGESEQNRLANVGESGESQHFLGFGLFLLAKFAKFAKFAKLQRMNLPCLKD